MKRIALALSLLASTASAQTFSLYAGGGKSITTWHGQAAAQSVSLDWTVPQSKKLDFGLAIEPRIMWQPRSWFGNQYGDGNEKVRAMSASFLARRHFGSRAVRPYIELLLGPMWADKQVPASTSRFNVVTQPGAGVTLWSQSRISPVIGYRFVHVSNGGYSPRNPGLNVSEALIGVRMRK